MTCSQVVMKIVEDGFCLSHQGPLAGKWYILDCLSISGKGDHFVPLGCPIDTIML